MKKILLIIFVFAALAGVAFWRFGYLITRNNEDSGPKTLIMWGLWEDEALMKVATLAFEKENPNIKIEYEFQSTTNYRNRVQAQVSQGNNPPDIFAIHSSWLLMFLATNTLAPMPSDLISLGDFKNTFYPVAADSLTSGGKIYALPLEIDGLGLFYNEELLEKEGVGIPKTWFEFRDEATKLTKTDEAGNITQAGAALGVTSNVDHWQEIIGLLFSQQPEANLEKPSSPALSDTTRFPGAEVIRFYTNFILDPRYKVWDKSLDSSTQSFINGKLAFYFAPFYRAAEIKKANANLRFKVAPLPQLTGKVASYGSFWVFAVSPRSQNQQEAWQFLKFLTSQKIEQLLFQQALVDGVIKPPSRLDLAPLILNDPILGAYVTQGPQFKSWYLASRTFDGEDGINSRINKFYEDAINEVLSGGDALSALQEVEQGVGQILEEYRNPKPSATQ